MFTIIFSYFIIAFVIVNTGNSEASVKRIVGGRPAKSSQWPMMVSVRQQNLPETLKSMNIPYISRNGHFCSGTLISPQWVVTAASCFQDSEVNKLLYGGPFTIKKVYKMISLVRTMVARMNLSQFFVCIKEDCSVWRSIENIIIHPRYLISIGGNKPGYDIALIKLGKPVEDYIPDLLSPSTAVNLSLNCKTAGWGVSDMQNFESSGDFQEFDVKLIPSQLCKPLIKLSEICGIGNMKGDHRSDFCFFDTGGPLICKGDSYDDDWKLLGLISRDLRSDCGDPDQKGIYTNIIGYYNWINSIIG